MPLLPDNPHLWSVSLSGVLFFYKKQCKSPLKMSLDCRPVCMLLNLISLKYIFLFFFPCLQVELYFVMGVYW